MKRYVKTKMDARARGNDGVGVMRGQLFAPAFPRMSYPKDSPARHPERQRRISRQSGVGVMRSFARAQDDMRKWTWILVLGVSLVAIASAQAETLDNPLFAYKNSMEIDGPKSVEEQVQILADIGLDGFDNRELEDLEATIRELDKHGLKLYTIYFAVRIDPGEEPYNPGLAEALPLFKNHGTILWCNVHSKQFKPSDPAGDEFAVPIFREIADMVAPYGVKVAPYPHINLWVESPEDTVRLADKVDRPNFGTSFNLYHWKVLGDRQRPIEEVAKALAPRMFVMSINGDEGPHNIGPLEAADIDEYYTVLKAFRDEGYRGPVGLQSYLIPGDPRENLGQSYAVWRLLQERFSTADGSP